MRLIGKGLNYIRFSPSFGVSLKFRRFRVVWSRHSGFIFTMDGRT